MCRWRYAVLCFFDVVNKPFADLAGAVCFGAVGCDVLGYYSIEALTAFRMSSASASRLNEYSSIIAADSTVARGLAMSLPAAWG